MKISLGEKTFGVVNLLMIFILCVIMTYPFLYQLAVSLNDANDALRGGITVYPRVFTLRNYEAVLSDKAIWNGLLVSVVRVLTGTAFSLTITAITAYVLTKRNLPGRKAFLTFLLIPAYIGGGLIPIYIVFRYMNLLDNFLVYIVPFAFSFYNMLIIREYLNTIPLSLEESAFIDGANELQIFYKIYVPLSKPVLATVALWIAVGHWNDWTTTLYFVNKAVLRPMQFILYKLVKEAEEVQRMIAQSAMRGDSSASQANLITPQTIQAATLMVTILPIVCLYPFLQKYFVSGIILGSVKE